MSKEEFTDKWKKLTEDEMEDRDICYYTLIYREDFLSLLSDEMLDYIIEDEANKNISGWSTELITVVKKVKQQREIEKILLD